MCVVLFNNHIDYKDKRQTVDAQFKMIYLSVGRWDKMSPTVMFYM